MGKTKLAFLGCVLVLGVALCMTQCQPTSSNSGSSDQERPTTSNVSGSTTPQDAKPYKGLDFHVTKVSLTHEDGGATTVFHVEAQSQRVEYRLECREQQYTRHTCAHLEAGQDYKVDLYPDVGTVAFIGRPIQGDIEDPYVISYQAER